MTQAVTTITIDSKFLEEAKRAAEDYDTTLPQLIRDALRLAYRDRDQIIDMEEVRDCKIRRNADTATKITIRMSETLMGKAHQLVFYLNTTMSNLVEITLRWHLYKLHQEDALAERGPSISEMV